MTTETTYEEYLASVAAQTQRDRDRFLGIDSHTEAPVYSADTGQRLTQENDGFFYKWVQSGTMFTRAVPRADYSDEPRFVEARDGWWEALLGVVAGQIQKPVYVRASTSQTGKQVYSVWFDEWI